MCECGHDLNHHVTMRDHVGPCMRCNCSAFSEESEDEGLAAMAEVSDEDLARLRADLERTVAELS